jgi:hypothetical protein
MPNVFNIHHIVTPIALLLRNDIRVAKLVVLAPVTSAIPPRVRIIGVNLVSEAVVITFFSTLPWWAEVEP